MASPARPDLELERYERAFFLDRVWDYRPDEHVTILGKTGSGKTHLAQELLERSATPENPAVVLVMKPKDATVTRWAKRVAYKRVTTWPQAPSVWSPRKPPGYVLWPKHTYRADQDNAAHWRVFERAIMNAYRKGNHIVFADEVSGLQRIGLTEELETVWERGRAMRAPIWATSQRPTFISSHAYTQASHVFLGNIKDERARKRFGEISGVDPKLVAYNVGKLGKHEWLYIRQEDSTMCIIGA